MDTASTKELASQEQDNPRKRHAMSSLQDHHEEASAPCADDLVVRLQERVMELENLMNHVLKLMISTREMLEYIVFVLVKAFAAHGHIDIASAVTQIVYNTGKQLSEPACTEQELKNKLEEPNAPPPGPSKGKEKITFKAPLTTNLSKPQAAKPKAPDSPRITVTGAVSLVQKEKIAKAENDNIDLEQSASAESHLNAFLS